MTASLPASGERLSAQLGLTERVLAGPRMRKLLRVVEDGLDRVEQTLARELKVTDTLADATTRYLYEAGGKRVRPMLTLLTAELGEGATDDVIAGATALEMTHLGSLYHDDVMDGADVRRGVPSAHAVWGNNVAILTGDLLFARASLTVAGLGPQAVELQARTFERLCLGQLRESVGPGEGDDPVAHYIQVLADKTASLLATSARFGAWFAGADEAYADMVAEYGERVGVAFQLADDVIDLTSPAEVTGKTPGTDLREGVPTMPTLLLRARVASGEGSTEDAELVALLDGDLSSDEVLAGVVERLRRHDVVEETRQVATRWAREAVDQVAGLPEGPVRAALESFANALVDRAS